MAGTQKGRPTKYSQKLADKLCASLSMGNSLKKTCEQKGMPTPSTVFNWFRLYPDFLESYTRAKEESADAMAEEIIDISNQPIMGEEVMLNKDGEIVTVKRSEMLGHRRLQIDTRKFLMAKMKPKRYGDKLDLTSDGKALPTPIYGGNSGKSTPKSKTK